MKRHCLSRRCAIGVGAGALAAPFVHAARAQQKMVLRFGNDHPAGYPTVSSVETMGRKLAAATNGRLSIQSFPSGTLGGNKESIEQLQVGAMHLNSSGPGWVGTVIPDVNVFNMPFIFRNTAHMEKVVDGPIGQELLDRITNHPTAGLVGLCWFDAGARSFYNTRRPIHTVADLSGLKFRVQGSPIIVDMVTALGSNAVPIGYDQVFAALQTGVVDGAENNMPSYVFDNHYQVAKFYTRTEHLIVPDILLASRKAWNSLSKDDQALIRTYSRDVQADARVAWNGYEKMALERALANGTQFVDVAPADKQAFQDRVKPVWDKYGGQFADIIGRIQGVPA